MPDFTPNYRLIKPRQTDYYDVDQFNANMDTLDGVVHELAATGGPALSIAQDALTLARANAVQIEALWAQVAQNTLRIETLWRAMFWGIAANPFEVLFHDLDGVVLESGVWNPAMSRLEC